METITADRATSPAVTRRDWGSWPRYDAPALGFREYWYPSLPLGALGRRAVSRTLPGDRVIFIRENGQVRAVSDCCLHRGVPLSLTANRFGGRGSAPQDVHYEEEYPRGWGSGRANDGSSEEPS